MFQFCIRFTSIPFSSNLGQTFKTSKQHTRVNSEVLVSRYERSCLARPLGNVKSGGKTKKKAAVSPGTFRPCVPKKKENSLWVHSDCFSKADRREKMITINTGSVHLLATVFASTFSHFIFIAYRVE